MTYPPIPAFPHDGGKGCLAAGGGADRSGETAEEERILLRPVFLPDGTGRPWKKLGRASILFFGIPLTED